MIGPIPDLITPQQELHGPAPLNVPGWEFLQNEILPAVGTINPGQQLTIKPNPNLYRRRLFAYFWTISAGAGWFDSTISLRYRGSQFMAIPFGFGVANLSPSGNSQSALLGFGTVPIAGSMQLNLSPPLIGAETNPIWVYGFDTIGIVDEITWTLGNVTIGIIQARIWIGCISQG